VATAITTTSNEFSNESLFSEAHVSTCVPPPDNYQQQIKLVFLFVVQNSLLIIHAPPGGN
ncbi:unnamed protein product, partial [Ceratitis capitata]